MPDPLRLRLARRLAPAHFAAVTARVDDSPGWANYTSRPHDYDPAQVQENYADALTAWRKNPIAWRIVALTTDYVIGDGLTASSKRRELNTFIADFWSHAQNHMDTRLPSIVEELSRAGDLFILLFRNKHDGMSYIRLVTKDLIVKIDTNPEDWEQELAFYERQPDSTEPRRWLHPSHPEAADANAVMLHFAVNRPAGALLGESDLAPLTPWLQRYSRMLEDRVRLHWAIRSFLYVVTVPGPKIEEKRIQYANPPEAGSIIVKDDAETWEAIAPTVHGADAQHDLKAVRNMIDAGSGYPPHWRGEPEGSSLATAEAMQAPPERHLRQRQRYVEHMLREILLTAFQRAGQIGKAHHLRATVNDILITCPDISRTDNTALAEAANSVAASIATMQEALKTAPNSWGEVILPMWLSFAGATTPTHAAKAILAEFAALPKTEKAPPVGEQRPPAEEPQ